MTSAATLYESEGSIGSRLLTKTRLPLGVTAASCGSRIALTRAVSLLASRSITETSLLKRLQTYSRLPPGASDGSARRVADRDRGGDLAGGRVDDADRALDAAAGDVQLGPVGGHGQARRSCGTSDRLGDVAAGHIDDQDLPGIRRDARTGSSRPGRQPRRCGPTYLPGSAAGTAAPQRPAQTTAAALRDLVMNRKAALMRRLLSSGLKGGGSGRGEAGRAANSQGVHASRPDAGLANRLMVTERRRNSERKSDLSRKNFEAGRFRNASP